MQTAFKITPEIKRQIIGIIDERIRDIHVTREDFSELKAIVKDIAEVQKRTEIRVEELAEAQKRTEMRVEELAEAQKRTEMRVQELAEVQKRTEMRVEELAEAQKRTEMRVEELAEAQKDLAEAQRGTEISVATLAKGLEMTRTELGGLSRSVGYSLENEAYRQLPVFLKEHYGIEVTERMIRLELEGEEINIFAYGKKDEKDVMIVGETELRLSSVGKLKHLDKKVRLVKKHYQGDCIPLLITHFARPAVLERAKEMGMIVVQSFEW